MGTISDLKNKGEAIRKAFEEQNKKKVAKSVSKPSHSYSKSRNRSKSSGGSGSSRSKSSKTNSGNVKQGGNGEKTGSSKGLTPPPDYTGPIPPEAPSIYDEGQPLAGQKPENGTGMPKDTQKAVEEAPYSPIKKKTHKQKQKTMTTSEYTQETYEQKQTIDTHLSNVQKRKKEIQEWSPEKDAAYYTIKDFDPTLLHGPGSTKKTAVDAEPDVPGWQLTPHQTSIYMQNLAKRYSSVEQDLKKASVQSQKQYQESLRLPPGTKITETKEGYEFKFTKLTPEQYKTKKELREFYQKTDPLTGIAHTWSTGVLSHEDPLGLKSFYYSVTGQKDKVLDVKAKAVVDLNKAREKGLPSYAIKAATSPFATIGISYGAGSAIGAGFGAAKAAFPVAGKVAETGFGITMAGVAAKQTIPQVQKALETKDYGDLSGTLGMIGVTAYSGYKGYKTGHTFGYGRTEAYLYRKHTFKPGSIQDIQFKEALRVSRLLEDVKSHKAKPLDIAKDISRMKPRTAAKTLDYLKRHPRTTIGGSAASYTQIEGARVPKDIDLLLPGGKKSVAQAKRFFGATKTRTGEHLIDIHGKSFYKPGEHHAFGFRSKTPTKIGGKRVFRAGEQLFRKGVASVKLETKYRWFKDRPDFLTHATSLIKSTKLSKNIFAKWRGKKAELSLQRYLNPKKTTMYGKKEGSFSKIIRKYTKKPVKPTEVMYKGRHEYLYPKYTYPSYVTGLTVGTSPVSYPKYSKQQTKAIGYLPDSKPSSTVRSTYPSIKKKNGSYQLKTGVGKNLVSYPKRTVDNYPKTKITSENILPKNMYPKVKTPKYKTTGYKAKDIIPIPTKTKQYFKPSKKKKTPIKDIDKLLQEKYKFRKFNIPSLKKILSGVNM